MVKKQLRKIGKLIPVIRSRIEKAERKAEAKRKGVNEAREKRRERLKRLDGVMERIEAEEGKAEREKLRENAKALRAEIGELSEKVEIRESALDKKRRRRQELRSRLAWGLKRRTTLRRKIKRAKASRDPKPESWHGNGHEWHNLTGRAKKLLAWAVKYGLFCSSITRGWGTGSHHEDVPTRGFDCAGSWEAMIKFQRDLRYGRIPGFDLSDLLELIGPDNVAWAKNGQPWSGAEGEVLEDAHDNHDHVFCFGA